MVTSITGSQSSNILAGISPQATSPSGSMGSFTDQLAAALEGYLSQSSNGSKLEIDIQSTQSQNSGVRQFIVTVKDPDSAPAQANAPTSAAVAPASASVTPPADTPAPPAPTNEIDAYWAAQPPAVQQLRDVTDFAARNEMAQNLANQGYTIDKAIMVWGWDPLKTMQTRMAYGYTWAPSFNQGNVSTPGLATPSQVPYDPSHPPPGSIAVNTDFAKGLGA